MSDPTPAPTIKPGYATTEGWLTFIIALCGVAPSTLGTNAPQVVQLAGLIGAILTTIAYQYHRTQVKTGGTGLAGQLLSTFAEPIAPEAPKQAGFARVGMMLVIAALGVACLSSSQKKAGEHAAFTCALDAISPHVQPIESALGQLDYKAALAQLNLPEEAIDCGIKTILAVFTAPRGSEPSLVVVHGREWLAEHGK